MSLSTCSVMRLFILLHLCSHKTMLMAWRRQTSCTVAHYDSSWPHKKRKNMGNYHISTNGVNNFHDHQLPPASVYTCLTKSHMHSVSLSGSPWLCALWLLLVIPRFLLSWQARHTGQMVRTHNLSFEFTSPLPELPHNSNNNKMDDLAEAVSIDLNSFSISPKLLNKIECLDLNIIKIIFLYLHCHLNYISSIKLLMPHCSSSV